MNFHIFTFINRSLLNVKPNRDLVGNVSQRLINAVISHWFIVFGQSDNFGFGFTRLSGKLL